MKGLEKGPAEKLAATAVLGSCDLTAWASLSSGPSQRSEPESWSCLLAQLGLISPQHTALTARHTRTQGLCSSLCLDGPSPHSHYPPDSLSLPSGGQWLVRSSLSILSEAASLSPLLALFSLEHLPVFLSCYLTISC